MTSWVRSPLPWLGGLLALYLIAPFAALFAHLNSGVWTGVRQDAVLTALRTSASAAAVATLLVTLAGVPLAYVFARGRSPFLRLLEAFVYLPLALPPLVSGILLLYLVAILENFGYRQLNAIWRMQGLYRWLFGRSHKWEAIARTASLREQA